MLNRLEKTKIFLSTWDYHFISQADKPDCCIYSKARMIAIDALDKIEQEGFANYGYENLRKITNCTNKYNIRLLKQISHIFDLVISSSGIAEEDRFFLTLNTKNEEIPMDDSYYYALYWEYPSYLPFPTHFRNNMN